MSKQLTVKISTLEETLMRFKNIWEKAEQGRIEGPPIEIISFEDAKLLMKTLSPRRLELLQQLHSMGKTSIRALAKKLARDYSNVYADVAALHRIGLVLHDSNGYEMPWEKIVTEIRMVDNPPSHGENHPSSGSLSAVRHLSA